MWRLSAELRFVSLNSLVPKPRWRTLEDVQKEKATFKVKSSLKQKAGPQVEVEIKNRYVSSFAYSYLFAVFVSALMFVLGVLVSVEEAHLLSPHL